MSASPLRVDYHMHTCYSHDSETPLEIVLERARAAGIGRLCVTDHDTIDGALRLMEMAGPGLEIVVGCEFSTEDGSQVVGLYLPEMIFERRIPELLHEIRRRGGKVLLPHPFRRGSGIFRREMRRSEGFVREVLALTDLIECFNGRDTWENNATSLAFTREHRLAAVASSDAHSASDIGSVFVEYPDSTAEDGLTERRIYFADQPQRREHAIKRSLLERYHQHKDHLPGLVNASYEALRRRYHRRSSTSDGPKLPRLQYELGGTTDRAGQP
jgi:predicted metal-dependent phosphoesterase TrpH